jgi:hypothetical protein
MRAKWRQDRPVSLTFGRVLVPILGDDINDESLALIWGLTQEEFTVAKIQIEKRSSWVVVRDLAKEEVKFDILSAELSEKEDFQDPGRMKSVIRFEIEVTSDHLTVGETPVPADGRMKFDMDDNDDRREWMDKANNLADEGDRLEDCYLIERSFKRKNQKAPQTYYAFSDVPQSEAARTRADSVAS